MDIDQAIVSHNQMKKRLLDYINGMGDALDPAVVQQDNQCALGKWLSGEGQSFRGKQAFWQVKSKHTAFHRHAADVARRTEAGDTVGAKQLMARDTDFTDSLEALVASLTELKRDVGRS